jgi:fibronectin type 3 domain-containing protein
LFHTNSDVGNLKEFALYRSDSLTFGYQKVQVVAPVRNAFAFNVSSELLNGDRQYYMVAAVSQDSDTTWSYPWYFFTLDQKPPERPIGLVGEIGDSGVVFLRWKPNSERDIRGYRVFMANDLKEEFVEVTAEFVDDTTFYDTLSLRNLSSEVYYKIAAVDRNYNNSDYSDWILLLKPDTIPPVPAVFKSYVVSDTGIVLTWVNSTSDDLQFNKLVRFSWDGGVDTLLRWEHDSCIRFVDSIGLVPGQMRYAILTCDEVPNIRQSHELYVQYELGYRKIQAIINAEVDREKKLILLTWQNEKDDIYSIDVYRSINTGPFKQIGSIFEKFEFGFEDIDLRINNSYTYKIRVTYQSGISSKMSSPLTVIY